MQLEGGTVPVTGLNDCASNSDARLHADKALNRGIETVAGFEHARSPDSTIGILDDHSETIPQIAIVVENPQAEAGDETGEIKTELARLRAGIGITVAQGAVINASREYKFGRHNDLPLVRLVGAESDRHISDVQAVQVLQVREVIEIQFREPATDGGFPTLSTGGVGPGTQEEARRDGYGLRRTQNAGRTGGAEGRVRGDQWHDYA